MNISSHDIGAALNDTHQREARMRSALLRAADRLQWIGEHLAKSGMAPDKHIGRALIEDAENAARAADAA